MKPEKGTYNPYFQHYINLFPSENFMKELNLTHNITQQILSLISPEKEDLESSFKKWMNISNTEQLDDVCIMGIKF